MSRLKLPFIMQKMQTQPLELINPRDGTRVRLTIAYDMPEVSRKIRVVILPRTPTRALEPALGEWFTTTIFFREEIERSGLSLVAFTARWLNDQTAMRHNHDAAERAAAAERHQRRRARFPSPS